MLVTRVKRWSLTYCRCLGIQIHSQKSEVKSEELMVEKSLKLNALIGLESSMDPRYMDNLEKNTLSFVLLQWKKLWTKRCVLNLLEVVSLLSVEKELGWGERLVQHTIFESYHVTLRFLWKSKVWPFGSGNSFKASICIMPSLYELWLGKVFDNSCSNLSFIFL